MEHPAKISPRKKQAELAYSFFQQAEQMQQHFTPAELAEATGYTITTAKMYLTKKWWWFVRKSQGGYIVQGLIGYPRADFFRDLSQKAREPSPLPDPSWEQEPLSFPLAIMLIALCILWAVTLLFLRKRSWWIIPV